MKKRGMMIISALVVVLFSGFLQGAIPASERAALIALYNSTNGDNWTNKSGWKTPPLHSDGFAMPGTEGNWFGVTLTGDNVTSIYFYSNGLSGSIPPELGKLSNLNYLSLYNDQLSGSIPAALGNLSKLEHLFLDGNQLSGSIPAALGNLSKLEHLSLDGNQLSGSIPPEIGNLSNLVNLWLNSNQLSGSIPPELGNLSNLWSLDLSNNQLSGSIPSELGNLSNLWYLILSNNQLSGSIPSQLGDLSKLGYFYLCNNQLSGSIPPELSNLSSLLELMLNNNQLSGSIPTQLGNLSGLQYLYLSDNQLSGSIPPELGNLSYLHYLYLHSNQLSGSIPSQLGNLRKLVHLWISVNKLSGSIPPELGNLGNLQSLDLSKNQLSSSIPPELGNLSNLQEFKLSLNQLSDCIPTELGKLSNLKYLYLYNNYLSGTIPSSFTNLTKISTLNIGYNCLSATDPTLIAWLNIHDPDWEAHQDQCCSSITIPTVTTNSVSSITATSAMCGGNVTSDGGATVTARGVCWSTSNNPTISNYKTTDGNGTGSFTSNITGLISDTTYYVRAYATNSLGTAYGEERSFVSGSNTTIPTVTTNAVSSITATSAGCGGNVTSDGGATVTAKGVCWNTAPNPTISNYKTTDGSGTGTFTSNITGLTPGTKYYVRAYATNIQGTSYGGVEKFITLGGTPNIGLNPGSLHFVGTTNGYISAPQNVLITNNGTGILNWNASTQQERIHYTPPSGTGDGTISVSVNTSGLGAGTYSGTITVSDPNATNSPQTVTVNITINNNSTPPFGEFSTPLDGAAVQSSIPVTGWALDDIGVETIKIYRTDGNGLAYIGDAVFVDGARPDIVEAYPDYPNNTRAGWGYMLLTNFLPNGGNGTYTLHAIATDIEGHEVTLGTKTITVDNAHAVKPFGAIDTPTQGGIASGNSFVNWGWVLTPQPNSIPTNGSTIGVWIDGVQIGHPTYDQYREDIAALFPGYANSNGAVGFKYVDTTGYSNGLHSIHWIATDSAGNTDGIGSRYFTIQNSSGDLAPKKEGARDQNQMRIRSIKELELLPADQEIKKHIIKELERIEIQLGQHISDIQGYLLSNNELNRLPIGSTLDAQAGTFSWFPGPGFLGKYSLVFVVTDANGQTSKQTVEIEILPKCE